MGKFFERDEDANVYRLVLVSRIQNNTLRRISLVATLPIMLLWWFLSLFFGYPADSVEVTS